MSDGKMMDALASAAADDLAHAMLWAAQSHYGLSGEVGDQMKKLAEAAVGSLAVYIIARTEHDDASRHEAPFTGL